MIKNFIYLLFIGINQLNCLYFSYDTNGKWNKVFLKNNFSVGFSFYTIHNITQYYYIQSNLFLIFSELNDQNYYSSVSFNISSTNKTDQRKIFPDYFYLNISGKNQVFNFFFKNLTTQTHIPDVYVQDRYGGIIKKIFSKSLVNF